ncbi:hypothetical protein [Amycolatopsis sp. NPDC001319]|uniref:hypothetical protein n=1 Tax=unclassified Amycolatopsis TaxID=2618356 RepID=UPI00367F43EC
MATHRTPDSHLERAAQTQSVATANPPLRTAAPGFTMLDPVQDTHATKAAAAQAIAVLREALH